MDPLLQRIKREVLGARYELSVAFVSPERIAELNTQYRKKRGSTNVLSFALTDSSGEVYLCPNLIAEEAAGHNLDERDYTAYLFIHALLHLKGYDHGGEMEELEREYLERCNIPITF